MGSVSSKCKTKSQTTSPEPPKERPVPKPRLHVETNLRPVQRNPGPGSIPTPETIGSSEPPKGLPWAPGFATQTSTNGTTGGTARSTDSTRSAKSQNSTKGGLTPVELSEVEVKKPWPKKPPKEPTLVQDQGTKGPKKTGAIKQERQEKQAAPSRERAKSAAMKADTRKSIVRQMERGIVDGAEEYENLFGLDKMKTRLQLKREKTKVAKEVPDEKKMKSVERFQKAAAKIQLMSSGKFEGLRTKLEETYMGNIGTECPSTAKVVRIFTSSTFTDTMHERNTLMQQAYPRIKTFCQELGYEFQVVDMRWGVRDQATDDHMGTEICMRELKLCQKLSTGPNFLSLMSHKYGYTDFPRCIEASEFETIMENIESKDVLDLFKEWYQNDLNAIPPAYVIASISSRLPDFLSTDQDKKNAAKAQWYKDSQTMQTALEQVAANVFDAAKARKYIRSVTETEMSDGILTSKDPGKHCLWLWRTIEGIEKQESSYLLSRYIECNYNYSDSKVKKSRQLLKDLEENQIPKKLPANRILKYNVKWNQEKGLDPTNESSHKNYLTTLSTNFVQLMSDMIQSAVAERTQVEDPLVDEIVQHIAFCQNKCETFYGREQLLKTVKDYVTGMSNEPLVLHGMSGSGKTSIMAMVAKLAWNWFRTKPAVILRFIGTTPESSILSGLLSSLTQQIRKAYNLSWGVSEDINTLTDEFHASMFLATSTRPLVIVLDSLDMLDPSYNARQVQWLPVRLRPNVKIIVSTLPGEEYECLPMLQTMIKTRNNFVQIPGLAESDVSGIISKWLELKQRRLTDEQRQILLTAFNKCPIPLFLKLSFDEASSWTSFLPKNAAVLEETVRASIDSLFQRLETLHGYIFVSRALGYLTTTKNGLTETELEDVMSCDDEVLNDVYMYWVPPVRRLPPLLLVRLRTDLSQYLVDRGADGVRVMFWYHRQFVEAAERRYCSDRATSRQLHAAVADFFAGTWADGRKKPYTTKKGESGEADRHVSSQPIKFGATYNIRKMKHLPYHRAWSGQLDLLKKECFSNFEFLLSKLKATSLWKVIDDFSLAHKLFPDDDLIAKVTDVLRLSQNGLLYDSNQLAPQILGRLTKDKATDPFLELCRKFRVPCILPNKQILTQPGGQLIHCLAGHKAEILSLDIAADTHTALTCSENNTVRLWNIVDGKQLRMFDGLGKVSRALFCNQDHYFVIALTKKFMVRSVKTGEKIFDIDTEADSPPMCLVGPAKVTLVTFNGHQATVYGLTSGQWMFTVDCDTELVFDSPGLAIGSMNYAAVTTSDQVYLTVLDVKKKQFSNVYRGFEPFMDEALGETIQYEIDEMAIATDEKHIVYSNIYTNDIVFLDFKGGRKDKVIKGNPNDYVRSLRCSLDGKSLYLVKSSFVNFYDIKQGNMSEELEHPVDVISASTNDMRTVITVAEDSNVRVWDRTRQVQKISPSPGITANRIRAVTLHANSRYVIGWGFKSRENDSQFMFIYDILKNQTVREKVLDCSIVKFEVLNDRELLVLQYVQPQLKVIDLNTLEVIREFQGHLPKRHATFKVVESRNEVITPSMARQNVKIYNIKTGMVVAVIMSGSQEKIEGLCVNSEGTIVVAFLEEAGPLLIINIARRKIIHILEPKNSVFTENEIGMTPDGKHLIFTVENVPPGATKSHVEEEVYAEVWSMQKGTKVLDLVDVVFYNKYQAEKIKSGLSSGIDSFEILDNNTVLVAHDDYIMRVFNINTGNILRRLKGHSTNIELVYNPDSPYILSYGCWTEENSLRLWNRKDFTCVASYTLDRTVTQLNFSSDGRFIFASTGKPAEIVSWRFYNFPEKLAIKDTDYPEIFPGQQLQGYLDLVDDDHERQPEPGDPDKDVEDVSSDDDDDFI